MYLLTEMDISRILLEGNFDRTKYSSSRIIGSLKIEHLLGIYLKECKNSEKVEKGEKGEKVEKFKKVFDILNKNRKKMLLEKIESILFKENRSVILKQEDTDNVVNIIILQNEGEYNTGIQLFENGKKKLEELRMCDQTEEEIMQEIEEYINQDFKLFV